MIKTASEVLDWLDKDSARVLDLYRRMVNENESLRIAVMKLVVSDAESRKQAAEENQ